MAIKGLTCRETRSTGAMDVLGRLRKGAPKTGNKPGADLDHFRFDSSDETLTAIFKRLYGDRPGDSFDNGIKFFFPKADLDENMPTIMAAYKGGSCWLMCDREKIVGERNDKAVWINYPEHRRPECRFPKCSAAGSCNATGKLRIVIPEFKRFGVVEVVVGALNDLEHVSKQLQEIEARVLEHGGDLSKVPLRLYRKTRSISCPNGNGQRARRDKSMIEVVIDAEFMGRSLAVREQFALASASSLDGDRIALPAVKEELDTESFRDEFGERVNTDFKATDLWAKIKMAFDQCRDIDRVKACHKKALGYCDKGKLPGTARQSLAVLAQFAKARIIDSGIEPIDVEVISEEPASVLTRFEAIAQRTGHTRGQVEAAAKALNLQSENTTDWTEEDCQKLRDRLYAYADFAVQGFGSTNTAGAEYQLFRETGKVDFADDEEVWTAWSAIAA